MAMENQMIAEKLRVMEANGKLCNDGSLLLSDNTKEDETLEGVLLEDLDSYMEDITDRLTISRMVSDSVIKGMVNAVTQEAAERIAQKELEVARLRETLKLYQAGRDGNGFLGSPEVQHKLCSAEIWASCSCEDGFSEQNKLPNSLSYLRNVAGEQFKKLRKEIGKIKESGASRKMNSGSVGLSGILLEKVSKNWMNIGIGWRGLNEEMERFKDNMEFTKLKTNQEGVDPDDVYSQVPYEKGFQFLWRIERQIGRPAFDEFLKKYIATFKFQSIDTDTFLSFLKTNVPGIEKEIDLILWTEGTGIPPDAYEPVSNIYTKIVSLANEFKIGRMPKEDEVADWHGMEWELYLENLPKSAEASQILALDARYRLSESKDYEVKVAFLQLAISSRCRDYYGEVEKTLKEVGRMKYLRPLYTSLAQGVGKEEEKILAKRVFAEARDCYHPIAQGVVESIFAKHL